jgi:O-antigen/teichoic acid export membrane protein
MGLKLGEYDKNILKLFSGTAMAQAISFLAVSLIAKQYGPAEYGIYAGFLASISILSILSTCKYELAIMLPDSIAGVLTLIQLSNFINLCVCFVIALFMVLAPLSFLNALFGIKSAGDRLIFLTIPIATYLLAAFQVLNYWLVRQKMFSVLSYNKILRSSLFGLFALGAGLFWPKAISLAIAVVLGHFFCNIFLRFKIKEVDLKPLLIPNDTQIKTFKEIGKTYKNFPTYILPAELMNVVCAQLPVFVFLWYFNSTESGYFSFILTLLNVPISLLAGAILDVFKERAAKDYRETGSCREAYISTLKKMLLVSVLPFIVVFFFGNDIIRLVFGEEWVPAGKFLHIMIYMFFFKFISSPLSFIFYIVNKQREDFLWHIYILISTCLSLYVGAIIYKDILMTIKLYAINFSVIYIIYLVRSFQLSKQKLAI